MNKISKKTNFNIYYANIIARMHTKFTLEEEKALHLIFKQINSFEKNDTTIKLNKLDFFDKLELQSTNRYNRYRKLIRGLINKTFVELIDEKGGELMGVVIYGSYWQPKESFFEVKLNDWFMPFIEELVKNYTKINLNNVLGFKSKHTLTLYKWLCSWTDENKKTNQRYITTKELKELFGLNIDDYVYNNKFSRADFEKKTIKSSIEEINNITNTYIKFKKIIKMVRFKIMSLLEIKKTKLRLKIIQNRMLINANP